uniref:Uncharacterized protein n=1 Tax=Arundo donax TaxID=35708 RepID=A0A0A9A160_ARUDO
MMVFQLTRSFESIESNNLRASFSWPLLA